MSLKSRIDDVLDRATASNRIVGAQVLVEQRGQRLYSETFGFNYPDAGTSLPKDAIFRLSSLTKPIVATTVLAMCDRGLMALSDPITKYLPEFQPALPDGSKPAILLDHLITHTAGLGGEVPLFDDERTDPEFIAVDLNRWHLPLEVNVQRLTRVPLQFAPGEGWAYSQGLDVLGLVAAKLIGGTLGDAVRQFVTEPLGMKDTAFLATDPSRLAIAYADSDTGPVPMRDPHSVPNRSGSVTRFSPGRNTDPRVYHAGGGGMSGTAEDFMLLLRALLDGGDDIIEPTTIEAGLRDHVPAHISGPDPGWGFGRFGAVLRNAPEAATPCPPGTVRWGGIYGHTWFIDPVNQIAALTMTNTALSGYDGPLPADIRTAIYDGLEDDT